MSAPRIIQGGMGAGVSGWPLARAVSQAGQLGVVAGTALDVILARRLQLGDPGGHMRRALRHFPLPGVAEPILERFFVPGGKAAGAPFASLALPAERLSPEREALIVAANFAEVFLAREGHAGPVGINYLEKIQLPTLPSLFGAMLAGVSHVLMGAGIPRHIPGILDRLAEGRPVELPLDVCGARAGEHSVRFDPGGLAGATQLELARPRFFVIVASATLATRLVRTATGSIDGFVVEGHRAGGHNASPRGPVRLDEAGEPIYGVRDAVDLEVFRALERPFWLAGSYASPQRLAEALEQGAAGIQLGTAFAYCAESGLTPEIKSHVLALSRAGALRVRTDPDISPTGFPFKVVQLPGTLSDPESLERRACLCDIGYLRHAYQRKNGKLGWRCPSESPRAFLRKGGELEQTRGKHCVCNGLLANIGLGQVRERGAVDVPLVTSGDDVATVARFLRPGAGSYGAADVIDQLLGVGAVQGADRGK